MAEQAEEKQLTLFITGAGQGVGLAATTLATRKGYKVIGTTDLGTVGAYRIRRAGGIPVYPDLTRESAVYSALQMAKADVAINAAPQVVNGIPQASIDYDQWLPWLEASTDAIMSAAGRADVKRVIHISAGSIYGDTHHEAIKEDGHLDLSNALAKALHHAEEAVLDGGVPGYVLRTGYIYGTHENGAKVAEALRGGKGTPSGKQATAWIFEDDVASAALLIAEKEQDVGVHHVYNIAGEETLTPNEFMAKFGEAYGIGEPRRLAGFMQYFSTSEIQRTLLGNGTLLDTSKAREELDWSPKGSISMGLDKMLLLWRSEEAGIQDIITDDSDSTEIVKV